MTDSSYTAMTWLRLLVVTWALLRGVCGIDPHDPPVVKTQKGPVQGVTLNASTGGQVDVWYSIPYAQPPIGDLRFRHPRPIDRWQRVKDTTDLPNSCFQLIDTFFGDFPGATMWNPNTKMSEDCLYLSVVVPKPRPRNAAVMVWFNGMGFYAGTSTLDVFDYKTFASEQNVIIVAPQYRVTALGFLYMDDAGVPGNAGLFDQLMALQWIQDNIHNFGGNNDNVTLFGSSGGAASASLHLLSPLSRNLFSQAIMQSGSATAPWAVISREESLHHSLKLAEAVGCPHNMDSLTEVIDCLRQTNVSFIVGNDHSISVCGFLFVPVVDGSFLNDLPIKSLHNNDFKKTNILVGSNSEEGNMFLMYFLSELFLRSEEVFLSRQDFERSVSELYPYLNKAARQAIMFEYTNWLDPEDIFMNREAIDKMVGDYCFTSSTNELAKFYALAGNNVYSYYYQHRSSRSLWPTWTGVLHGDEIPFVFGKPLDPKNYYTSEEIELSRRMMTFWANFAKTGNPNLGSDEVWTETYWPIHSPQKREYLTLSTTSIAIESGPRLKQSVFWKNYLPQLSGLTDKQSETGCSEAHKPSSLPVNVSESSTTESPKQFIEIMGHLLHFNVTEKATWLQAQSYCYNLQGSLAKLDDANLLHEIYNYAYKEGMEEENFWIGGSDSGYEGEWRWLDDTHVKMGSLFWGTACSETGQHMKRPEHVPDRNCLSLLGGVFNFHFYDEDCQQKYAIICQHVIP